MNWAFTMGNHYDIVTESARRTENTPRSFVPRSFTGPEHSPAGNIF